MDTVHSGTYTQLGVSCGHCVCGRLEAVETTGGDWVRVRLVNMIQQLQYVVYVSCLRNRVRQACQRSCFSVFMLLCYDVRLLSHVRVCRHTFGCDSRGNVSDCAHVCGCLHIMLLRVGGCGCLHVISSRA